MNGASPSRTRSLGTALLLLLVLTNCVLAFMVVTFSGDLSRIRKHAATQLSVQAVDDRVAGMEQALLAARRSAGAQGRSVSELETDLKRLQEATFGSGPSGVEYDAIGDLEDQVESVETTVRALQSSIGAMRSCLSQLGLALSSSSRSFLTSC